MKRTITAILCIVMILLCGCGNEAKLPAATPAPTATSEPAQTPTPTATSEPVKTEKAYVRSLEAPAIISYLSRGTEAEIIGEQGEYYILKTEVGTGYVEKRLVYTESDPEFESRNLYAGSQAKLYSNYHLYGQELLTIGFQQKMIMLADLGDCYEVEFDGVTGFVNAIAVKNYIADSPHFDEPRPNNDGQDIPLAAKKANEAEIVLLANVAPQSGKSSGKAEIKADGTELILAIYELNEEVSVIKEKDGVCTVSVNGTEASMERRFIRMDSEKAYESWNGYAPSGSGIYDNIYLLGDSKALSSNTELTVLDAFDNCYLVKVNSTGVMGYVDDVMTEPQVYYGSSGGGDTYSGPEWSDPVL